MQIFRIHRDSNFKRHHVCSGNFLYQFRLPLGGILVLRLHLVSLLFTHCSTTVYILFIGSIFLSPLFSSHRGDGASFSGSKYSNYSISIV